ncbi:HAD-IC family P-type ATPase [Sporobacter termitidis]|uniref:HAD-IC family P-type ATPase n=1 Tax=Sporobacter termitidis TaxID=44749 RepID=UPI0013564F7C|nr:HAD-IC family P-type ATPase [Sporobacter termitidis]
MPTGRKTEITLNKVLPRIEARAELGLTAHEARERLDNGYGNISPASPEKTVAQIFRDNIFTYFNLIFFVLAGLVISVHSYRNLTFMGIILANIAIGIVQELRAKRTLSKLRFIAEPHAAVIRDGQILTIPAEDAVLDDIAVFTAGQQIYADAIILTGECRVNEALVTGEADEIIKTPGGTLLSGSFIVSGECRARLDKVGCDSFVSKLTVEAKKHTRKRRSEMMRHLTRLVQIIGFIIIPFGIALYLQQTLSLQNTVADSVVTTVAALIGMIPEGLYLLVSVALTVSVMRLAQKKTLVHDLDCIETLARVDVLCVDKTGTITENKMTVREAVPLSPDTFGPDDVAALMADYTAAMGTDNETMAALKNYFTGTPRRHALQLLSFSSATKYGGVTFSHDGTFLLGAPEKILLSGYDKYKGEIEKYSSQGCRVLLLARYAGSLEDKTPQAAVTALALIVLTNSIRPEAPETFRFFKEQGVAIKVISGDNPLTVSRVALEAGIENADKYIDASTLTTERKLKSAIKEYTVFGRVTPDQKRKLIRAFKEAGHTVAMTGDGVNDVLALKDADCSIAMASGSDVACQVSQLVLMNSNFAAMPSVVSEGRRVINNIERSASLFLVKNIFSFALALTALLVALPYPITPAQLSLFNATLIGIPSFILALEPNTSLVRGRFLKNVLLRALPAGLTDFLCMLAAILACSYFNIPGKELGTMSTIIIGAVGFMMLYRISRPLNNLRRALMIAMFVLFAVGGLVFTNFFTLVPLSLTAVEITAVIVVLAVPVMTFFAWVTRKFEHDGRKAVRRG